ncbi:MAG: hypothetical protein ABIT37_06610, partial [Luteolibacter sp.]
SPPIGRSGYLSSDGLDAQASAHTMHCNYKVQNNFCQFVGNGQMLCSRLWQFQLCWMWSGVLRQVRGV